MAAQRVVAARPQGAMHPAAGRARHGDFDDRLAQLQGGAAKGRQIQLADMDIAAQIPGRDGRAAKELADDVEMFGLKQRQRAFAGPGMIADQACGGDQRAIDGRNIGQPFGAQPDPGHLPRLGIDADEFGEVLQRLDLFDDHDLTL